MIALPDITVWPYLLGGAALCGVRNIYAGLLFALAVVSVKAIQYFGFNPPQVYFFAMYSFLGVISFFSWDKHAGVVLCLVGVFYAAHLLGFVSHDMKLLMTEVSLFLGMLNGAYNGPSGGILARRGGAYNPGHHYNDLRGEGVVSQVEADSQEGVKA